MKLVLSEEQEYLRETASNFAKEKTPVSHLRSLRDSEDTNCWDKKIWDEMVSLGWSGILIPEQFGGSDFGLTGISVILQELGRTLSPSPLFATSVLGVTAINQLGNEDQKKDFLGKIAKGEITCCLAVDEGTHHNLSNVELTAKKTKDGWILNGSKVFIIDGASADVAIIIARTSGIKGDLQGLTAFVTDTKAKGISIKKVPTADSRNYANFEIKDLNLTSDDLLGNVDDASDSIQKVLDFGRIALAAEMLGNTQEAFDVTIQYLKDRKQFGVPIGSFQALQHRAAKMFCEIELTKSAVMAAMNAADESSNQMERLSSLAKYQAGQTLHLVSNESIQMHGGIGVTDEYDVGLFLKRARVTEQIFGNSEYHLDRYATLSEY